jgi:hypothetical protein
VNDLPRAVMEVEVPKATDVLHFKTSDFSGVKTRSCFLLPRTVRRPLARQFPKPTLLHKSHNTRVRRHLGRSSFGWIHFQPRSQIVRMEFSTPTRVEPVILGKPALYLFVH